MPSSTNSFFELYNNIVRLLWELNWRLYELVTELPDTERDFYVKYVRALYKIKVLEETIKEIVDESHKDRILRFFVDLKLVISDIRFASGEYYNKYKKSPHAKNKIQDLIYGLYQTKFYFEAKYPYVFIETPRRKAFLIFNEEDNKIYFDVFENVGFVPTLLANLNKALKECYGLTPISRRIQGDLHVIMIPINSPKSFIENMLDYTVRVLSFAYDPPLLVLLPQEILRAVMNQWYQALNDNDMFNDFVDAIILVANLSHIDTVKNILTFIFGTLPDSVTNYFKTATVKLSNKYSTLVKEIAKIFYVVAEKSNVTIELRRNEQSNPHIIKTKGLLLPFIPTVLVELADLSHLKQHIPRNIIPIPMLIIEGDIIIEHPEHNTVKLHIDKPHLVIFYIPSGRVEI